MLRNDEESGRLMGELIRKTGTEEPSVNFTDSVMQSLQAVPSPVKRPSFYNYLWFLLALPLLAGSVWYLLFTIPEITGRLLKYYDVTHVVISSVFSFATHFIQGFRSVSFSPVILISFIAGLILLLIDYLYSRKKSPL